MYFSWNVFLAVGVALLLNHAAVLMAAPTPAPPMSFLLTPETLPVISDNFDEQSAVIPKTPTPGNAVLIVGSLKLFIYETQADP